MPLGVWDLVRVKPGCSCMEERLGFMIWLNFSLSSNLTDHLT